MNSPAQRRRYLRRAAAAAVASILLGAGIFFLCTPQLSETDTKPTYPITLTLDDRTSVNATFSGKPITAFCGFRDSTAFGDVAWHLGFGKIQRAPATPPRSKSMQVQLFWDIMPLKKDSSGRYFDTVYVSLGGENTRSNPACVIVTNVAPVIDSVKISRRSYAGQDTIRDTLGPYDTLAKMPIRVFARDANLNVLASSWSGGGSSRVETVSGSINANYQLLRDDLVDTLALSVYDRQGGNCDRVIIITSMLSKNRAPLIDSLKVKDTVYTRFVSPPVYAAAVLDSLHFRVWPRDSDAGGTMQAVWAAKNAKQAVVRSNGFEMTWACTSKTCRDTLTSGGYRVIDTVAVTVRDNMGATVVASVVIVKGANKPPLFDSLRVNDSLITGTWTRFSWSACAGDSLRLKIYAHDPDSLDSTRFTIRAGDSARLKSGPGGAALYVCRDSLGRDTVSLLLSDTRGASAVRLLIVGVDNRFPLLDSVGCGDSLFRSETSLFSYKANGLDSLPIRFYAHDPDAGDMLRDTLYASSGTQAQRVPDAGFLFVCPDSTYVESLTCAVSDSKFKRAKKQIVIGITKR
jgi:hypothetical protein